MKKTLKEVSAWIITITFCFSPILLFIMYITYSEKVIAPILIALVLLSVYIIYKWEE